MIYLSTIISRYLSKSTLIYSGAGVGENSLYYAKKLFKNHCFASNAVNLISRLSASNVLVMPGGADIPYHKELRGMDALQLEVLLITAAFILAYALAVILQLPS